MCGFFFPLLIALTSKRVCCSKFFSSALASVCTHTQQGLLQQFFPLLFAHIPNKICYSNFLNSEQHTASYYFSCHSLHPNPYTLTVVTDDRKHYTACQAPKRGPTPCHHETSSPSSSCKGRGRKTQAPLTCLLTLQFIFAGLLFVK